MRLTTLPDGSFQLDLATRAWRAAGYLAVAPAAMRARSAKACYAKCLRAERLANDPSAAYDVAERERLVGEAHCWADRANLIAGHCTRMSKLSDYLDAQLESEAMAAA